MQFFKWKYYIVPNLDKVKLSSDSPHSLIACNVKPVCLDTIIKTFKITQKCNCVGVPSFGSLAFSTLRLCPVYTPDLAASLLSVYSLCLCVDWCYLTDFKCTSIQITYILCRYNGNRLLLRLSLSILHLCSEMNLIKKILISISLIHINVMSNWAFHKSTMPHMPLTSLLFIEK